MGSSVYELTENEQSGRVMMDEPKLTDSVDPKTHKVKDDFIFIISGVGCALLLSFILLSGAGALAGNRLIYRQGSEVVLAAAKTATVPIVTSQKTPTFETTVEPIEPEAGDSAAFVPPPLIPQLGPIIFSPEVTTAKETIDPVILFEAGITKIYATFDYSGLSPNDILEQVWYYNGKEISRISQRWSEAQNGRFSYEIDAGGEPLSVGEWKLEIYREGQLLTQGSFVVEAGHE
jgi:hypothetical protein